jgi:hypothetical protein
LEFLEREGETFVLRQDTENNVPMLVKVVFAQGRHYAFYKCGLFNSKEPIPPGWESIPGLLKSFINTGSGNVRVIANLLFAELCMCMAAVKYDTAPLKKESGLFKF